MLQNTVPQAPPSLPSQLVQTALTTKKAARGGSATARHPASTRCPVPAPEAKLCPTAAGVGMWCHPHLAWHGVQQLAWGLWRKMASKCLHIYIACACWSHCQLWDQQSEKRNCCPLLFPLSWSRHRFPGSGSHNYCLQRTATESDHQEPGQSVCWQLTPASSPASCSLLCFPLSTFSHSHSHLHSFFLSSEQQFSPVHTPSEPSKLTAANPWVTFIWARHCWQQGCHAQSSPHCSGEAWPWCFQDTDTGCQDEIGTIPESFPWF